MISVQCTRTDSSTESVRHINIKVLGRQTYATPNPMSQIPVVQAYLVPDGSPGAVSSAVPMTGMNYPPAMAPASIEALDKLLIDHHWPAGLRRMLHQNTPLYHKRYFILDDSSSMMTNDGMKLIGQAANQKFYPCSRWSELTAAMRFHAELASHASVPTEFRFLNKGTPVKFGINCDNFAAFHALLAHLDSSPGGSTPLVQHINAVVHEILTSLPELRATGRKAVLIIASDGEASDGDVGAALAPLQHLPVW